MEDWKLMVQYTADGKKYQTDRLNTSHFNITAEQNGNRLKMVINPIVPVMISNFTITLPYKYDEDSRVFVNGYQSWTDSREYFIHEKMSMLHPLVRGFIMKSNTLNRSGDYLFHQASKEIGVFNCYSYSYVRLKDRFDLFGSLNERSGFTIFVFDTVRQAVTVRKEVDGVTFNGESELMDIVHITGDEQSVFDQYFAMQNIPPVEKKLKSGYTTWYNYYNNINEKIVYSDSKALSELNRKVDIFQIDDGFQKAIGDWLETDPKKFPGGMKKIAEQIHQKKFLAGLWLAPFAAVKDSKLFKEHPDWFIHGDKGEPYLAGPNWGGFYALDFYNKGAADYIRNVFDVVFNNWGYDMVKLDFLYAACVLPLHNKSRGQIMCEAMDFIRECAGNKLVLGCGVPLAPTFGKVDFCRIGADMGLSWKPNKYTHRENVSTPNAVNSAVFRRQLDGRAFLNDPDVFLLRDENIHMSLKKRKLIAKINHIFGNLLFTSDNVGNYDDEKKQAFYDAIKTEKEEVVSAEYERPEILKIVYRENGKHNTLRFNINNGKQI